MMKIANAFRNGNDSRNIAMMFRSTALALIVTEITEVIAIFIDGIVTSTFLGIDAYSGISLLKPFTSIISLASGVLATGCNILCSRFVGSGKKEEANCVFNLSAFLAVIIGGLFILASVFFPDTVLTLCGVNLKKMPELNQYLYDYLHGYMVGIPAIILIQVISPILVMDNGKKLFAFSSLVLCVSDIIFDLLNVYVFHGGVLGMGLASAAAMCIQLLILLPHFLGKSSFFRFSLKHVRFSCLRGILKNGSPAFVKKMAMTLRDVLTNYLNLSIALTAAAIAAKGIQGDFSQFLFCIPTGLGRTLITMVGIYYSANDLRGLQNLYSYSFKFGLLLSSAASVLTFVAAPLLAGLYTQDPETLSLSVYGLRWISVTLLFDTCFSLIQHYYQGIGNLKHANLLSFSERFIVPVLTAFILGSLFGSKGILASPAVGKMILLLGVFIANVIRCKRIPNSWKDIMLLPKDFGGLPSDNMYAIIQTKEDVVEASRRTQAFCLEHNIDKRRSILMALFVEEMSRNAINHPVRRRGALVFVDFRLYIKGNDICFSMMDLGKLFNPELFYEMHREESPETHIGTRMITKMSKEVRYFSTFRSNNLVIYL
jgi:Na+-driven multidrug efflux pump/anti-sigma regulatory factor (Ser/Thr protein kinase)